jgi:putative phosphoserine phosphatase / 1-acylglycerol-3-phosphate O-acyltransferase
MSGGRAGAFFDFDGTLIDGFSAFAFLADRARRDDLPLEEAFDLVRTALRAGEDFDGFMRRGCRPFRGTDEAALVQLGERLREASLEAAVFPGARELVGGHLAQGHVVVVATSALRFQAEPTARALGVEHVLCTELEVAGGVCTGRVAGPVVWGEGKAAAVRAFAQEHGIDLAASSGYANGDEDLAFLQAVGHPTAVNPKPELARHAAQAGWPVLELALPDRPGTVRRLAGAACGLASGAARLLGPG